MVQARSTARMRARRQGRILLLSSAGGVASVPFSGYYCATKHALEAYGEALRLELEPFRIRVAIVAPGTVSTAAGDKAMRPDKQIADYEPIRGLYASGDVVGLFFHNYPGNTGQTRNVVFSRVAGRAAAGRNR